MLANAHKHSLSTQLPSVAFASLRWFPYLIIVFALETRTLTQEQEFAVARNHQFLILQLTPVCVLQNILLPMI